MSLKGDRWPRILGTIGFALVIGAICLVVVGWQGLQRADQLASVLSGATGILALLFARTGSRRQKRLSHRDAISALAKELLVDQERRRGVAHEPSGLVINLRWTGPIERVADSPQAVAGDNIAGNILRIRLRGDLRELANSFRELPRQRLVILGEAGSGKTMMANRLSHRLLVDRNADDRLPVVLSMATWNPFRESLNSWIATQVAARLYASETEAAAWLQSEGLLLPILDGFDEIPPTFRPEALKAINRTIGRSEPIVITSRTAEYFDTVRVDEEVLSGAAVIAIEPVDARDAITYLRGTTPARPDYWDVLFEHLRSSPNGPLARALKSPLMNYLMAVNFRNSPRGMRELFNDRRFNSLELVEKRLFAGYILASYPELPEPERKGFHCSADRAQQWLRYIARTLVRRNASQIAWWEFDRILAPTLAALAFVFPVAVFGLAGYGMVAAIQVVDPTRSAILSLVGVILGAVVGLVPAGIVASVCMAKARYPTRLSFGLGHGLMTGIFVLVSSSTTPDGLNGAPRGAAIFLSSCGFAYVSWILTTNRSSWHLARIAANPMLGCFGAILICIFLAALPAVVLAATSRKHLPLAILLFVVFSIPFRLVFGSRDKPGPGPWMPRLEHALVLPTLEGFEMVGDRARLARKRFARIPHLAAVRSSFNLARSAAALSSLSASIPPLAWAVAGNDVVTPETILMCLAGGTAALISSTYGRFELVQVGMKALGVQPLRLISFMEDAEERGIFRRLGDVFEFRHARLRDFLS